MKNMLAIISARSGSKGLKDKNIKELCSKPLMAYSIEAALQSGVFDEVMVSTDSEKYADIAEKYGASVPFLRSEKTSGDNASSADMIREVLQMYKKRGEEYKSFCLLQPTSPLRTAEDIRNAYRIFEEKAEVAVVSVCEPDHSPLWCGQLGDDESLDGFQQRHAEQTRQQLEKYYRLNGAIYMAYVEEYIRDDFLYREGSYAYIMPRERSVDIDSEMDFRMAEVLMKEKRG